MAKQIGNTDLIDTWASEGNIVDPDPSKKEEGWLLGEQPPHEWMNHIQNEHGQKINRLLDDTYDEETGLNRRVIYVDTIADLQALDTSGLVEGQPASVSGGSFIFIGGSWQASGPISVKSFGAQGDGETDDTSAFQDALDFASAKNSSVYVPSSPEPYVISERLIVRPNVKIFGDGGGRARRQFSSNIGAGSTIYHSDVSDSLFELRRRSEISGIRIQCNNTDNENPIVCPPTIDIDEAGYASIRDVRFEYSYIAIGNSPGNESGAISIDGVRGFVHHRMVYLEGHKDIAWVHNLHSQNPDGIAWESSWYSFNNKVLVEFKDMDGAICGNWYTYAGRSIFKNSGTSNLKFDFTSIKAENITHGIEIAEGTTNNNGITFTGGYLQTNNRGDAEYLLSLAGNVHVAVIGMSFAQSQNVPHLFIEDGNLNAASCNFRGSPGATLLEKKGGSVSIDSSLIRSYSTVLKINESPSGVVLGNSNIFGNQSFSSLYDQTSSVLGDSDIFVPSSLSEDQFIYRNTSEKSHFLRTSGVFRIHEARSPAETENMSLELSVANNSGATFSGGKGRVSVRNRSGTPGNERASLILSPYDAGDFASGVELREDGSFRPEDDSQQNLGSPNNRWSELFAANGTINTSDQREKQQVSTLSEAEAAAATEIKSSIRKFKWSHAVSVKGDSARWHFGVMAQEVAKVFERHGLDAHEYGLFCYDRWDEEVDGKGGVLVESGDRYGVRYDQLLAFIISAM